MRRLVVSMITTAMTPGCRAKSEHPAPVSSAASAVPSSATYPTAPTDSNRAGGAEQVLAKIGSRTITQKEFADLLGSQSAYLAAAYNSPAGRRKFLEKIVHFEVMAAEAEKRGIDKRPSMERVREEAMVDAMMRDIFETHGLKLSDITNAEIVSYFNEHPDEFTSKKFEDVEPGIRNQLWRNRYAATLQAFMTDLRNKASVREHPELVDSVLIPPSGLPASKPVGSK